MSGSGRLLICVLAIASVGAAAADESCVVQLRMQQPVELTVRQAEELRALAVQLIETSNFNTVDQRELLKQSDEQVQNRYRMVVSGPHIMITLPEPVSISTLSGSVRVTDIVIGLRRSAEVPGGVFTLDDERLIRGYEKYSGTLFIKLLGLTDSIASAEGWGNAI